MTNKVVILKIFTTSKINSGINLNLCQCSKFSFCSFYAQIKALQKATMLYDLVCNRNVKDDILQDELLHFLLIYIFYTFIVHFIFVSFKVCYSTTKPFLTLSKCLAGHQYKG